MSAPIAMSWPGYQGNHSQEHSPTEIREARSWVGRLSWLWFALGAACGVTSEAGPRAAEFHPPASPPAPQEPPMNAQATEHEVTRGGMQVRWRVEGEHLFLTMRAPTTGWVAVGLNDRAELSGSLLVMGAVQRGVLRVEEHIAQPPYHPTRQSLGGSSALLLTEGEEGDGETRISVSLDLSRRDQVAPHLRAGDEVFLTLAFSLADDFLHHSVMRTAVQVTL